MTDDDKAARARGIRSYVLRGGRMTQAQQRAMSELYPRLGVPAGPGRVRPARLFDREAPLVLDIGFGNGEATWRMAKAEPDRNFLGIEVHPPGVGHLLLQLDQREIDNVRVAHADAVEFLRDRLADGVAAEVRIFFPDPWPKKRHHKRRLVQPAFIDLVAQKLEPGGLLHLATDWAPYAEWMLEVIGASDEFDSLSEDGQFVPQPDWRPDTKYQRRGEKLGQPARDLLYRRI